MILPKQQSSSSIDINDLLWSLVLTSLELISQMSGMIDN